jgi:hypothetical protein
MPRFADCEDVSGQYWKMEPDGDYYRMTSMFSGRGTCLDVVNGGPMDRMVTVTGCGNYSGQLWRWDVAQE